MKKRTLIPFGVGLALGLGINLIPLIFKIIGGLVVILALFLFFRHKSRQENESSTTFT